MPDPASPPELVASPREPITGPMPRGISIRKQQERRIADLETALTAIRDGTHLADCDRADCRCVGRISGGALAGGLLVYEAGGGRCPF